jgi:hypothetical protein
MAGDVSISNGVLVDHEGVPLDIASGGGVPAGGDTDQVLAKASSADHDTEWVTPSGGPGGGAPTDATYLVTTANGTLSAEVVVGTTPGGELGGTWPSPTVDTIHSGSSHAGTQAAAEATASADATAKVAAEAALARNGDNILSGTVADARIASTIARDSEVAAAYAPIAEPVAAAHISDTSDAHDASAISISDAGGDFTATDVEGALAELQADHEADATALTDHIGDASGAHAASAVSVLDAGGDFTATDVEGVLTELAGMVGGGSQTPWTSDIDGDNHNLVDVGRIGIGTGSITAGATVDIASTATGLTASRFGIYLRENLAFTATVATYGINSNNSVSITSGNTFFVAGGFVSALTVSGAGNVATGQAGSFSLTLNNTGTNTLGVGVATAVGAGSGATIATGVGVDVSTAGVGTITTAIGLRITALGTGTTKWGMQVGDYQSYHHGKMTFGATTAPVYAIDLQGTGADRAHIGLVETATPTNPTQDAQVVMYCKANKIVFAWNDAGTMRYKYLDMTGTGVTWVHSTTAP